MKYLIKFGFPKNQTGKSCQLCHPCTLKRSCSCCNSLHLDADCFPSPLPAAHIMDASSFISSLEDEILNNIDCNSLISALYLLTYLFTGSINVLCIRVLLASDLDNLPLWLPFLAKAIVFLRDLHLWQLLLLAVLGHLVKLAL